MGTRHVRIFAAVLSMLLISFSGFAQEKRKSASLDGTTGLFKTWDAEALRRGEFNLSFGYDRFNRDPGEMEIQKFPAAFAISAFDRLEFFASIEVQKTIDMDRMQTYRVAPGETPRPTTTLTGYRIFNQDAPFMDVPTATGRGDVRLGMKFNILSEQRGKSVSVGLAGFGKIPGHKSGTALNRGLSNSGYEGGFAFLVSKSASNVARLHFNLGYNIATDSEVADVDYGYGLIYRFGAEFPPHGSYRFIAELDGNLTSTDFLGGGSTRGLNPVDPLELILGLRVYPAEWISIGGGYQASLRHLREDLDNGVYKSGYHGAVAQIAFGTRRNDPPEVTCAAAKSSILQEDTITVRASGVDPDRDTLTYSWESTGAKISGSGDTVTFDASGLAPGDYKVTVTVSDGKHEVSCSTVITVLKRNQPPTISCAPASTTITQGDSTKISATASDPNNDQLTYTWTVNGEKLAAAGSQITFGSEGRQPGQYAVTATVSDGEETASCTSTITVQEKPNQPPVIECLTTTLDVASDGAVQLRARASDPDGGDVTISWSSTGGKVSGTGDTATFNAAGVRAGSYTVTATAVDSRQGRATCTMTVNVSERLSITQGEECGYFSHGGVRVDNCAKAILDDLAVRMTNQPELRANIIGYIDASPWETSRKALGERRAKAVASYLEEKGIAASRMIITDGGTNDPIGDNQTDAGRRLNRRVEIELSVR